MIEEKDLMAIGKFLKPHALKGELNAVLEVDLDILDEDYPLIINADGIYVPFYVETFRPKGSQGVLIKLDGVDSAEDARTFVNKEIHMLRRNLAEFFEMDEDELMAEDDMQGYEVFDRNAGYIGKVMGIDTSTENVLLEVAAAGEPENTVFIPFVDDFVVDIRHSGEDGSDSPGRIDMTLPDGILNLND